MKGTLDPQKCLSLPWLKEHTIRAYYFGLGFIQLKFSDRYRAHFYSPELPPITEDVHNHRYYFKSTILKGKLHAQYFRAVAGDNQRILNVSCDPIVKADNSVPRFCGVNQFHAATYAAGSYYEMDPDLYHRVRGENCITLVDRFEFGMLGVEGYTKKFAQVIVPVDGEPVCPFSKRITDEELWEIVGRMLE